MDRRRGLTRAELLVVVGVVTFTVLLVLPFFPRTSGPYRQPQVISCMGNLKQWGLVFKLYTDDHDGSFVSGEGGDSEKPWFELLRPYYEDYRLCLCTAATKPHTEGGRNPFGAWQVGEVSGSYGLNGWVCNPQQENTELWGRGPAENYWQTPLKVRGSNSNNVPILADAMWSEGWPSQTDEPPPDENWPSSGVDEEVMKANQDEMRRFCVNRHEGHVKVMFMDWSVRSVGLKELWTLKWHRNYDANGPWTMAGGVQPSDWPGWMRNFRDY